jgi:hypothetical protein
MQIIRNVRQGKLRYVLPLIGPIILIVAGLMIENTAIWIVGVVLLGPALAAANRSPR